MTSALDYNNLLDTVTKVADQESQLGYLHFLRHVIVDAQPDKKSFLDCGEWWQWEREERSAAALDNLAGITDHYDGPLRFWHGYAKGHDKTHAIARKLCWLLAYSRKRLKLYAFAGDKDQAGLLIEAMDGTLKDNEWLATKVKVNRYDATGDSGSDLTIMPLDANTGHGIFPDYCVAEEVSHWKHDAALQFWNFIASSVNKRPRCILEVCTNAGHIDSWQHKVRNVAAGSPFWSFYEQPADTPFATWMNQERIAEDSKLMLPGEVARLHGNRWIDPGEENGFLTAAECAACVDSTLEERYRGEPNTEYWAVVDYGGVHDRCALSVLHAVPGTDTAVVDRLDCWQGSHASRIDIDINPADPHGRSVEGWLELTRKSFRCAGIVLDPYQLEGLAIKLERRGVRVERFEYMAGKSNYRMAVFLQNMIRNKRISWSPQAGLLPGAEDATFAQELCRLVLKPMSYGWRWDHESGRHDDRAACVGMGILYAMPECRPLGKHGPTAMKAAVVDPSDPNRPRQQTARPVPTGHKDWAGSRGLFGMR